MQAILQGFEDIRVFLPNILHNLGNHTVDLDINTRHQKQQTEMFKSLLQQQEAQTQALQSMLCQLENLSRSVAALEDVVSKSKSA